jgi:hypothetical protein
MVRFSPRGPHSPSDGQSDRVPTPLRHDANRIAITRVPIGLDASLPETNETVTSYVSGDSTISGTIPNTFEALRAALPKNLEVRRFDRLAEGILLQRQWQRIRSSHFESDRIPNGLDMDCLHYRFATERDYCHRLSKLQPPSQGYVTLSTNILCIPTPWVPGAWRNSLPLRTGQRLCPLGQYH